MTPVVYDVLRRDAQDMCRLYRTEKPPAHHVRAPSFSAEIEYSVLAPSYSCLTTTIGAGRLNCRVPAVEISLQYFVLAPTYSCLATTIGAKRLNCRVRNENGCIPLAKALAQNT